MPTTTKYLWSNGNIIAEADETDTINVVYTYEPQQYGNLISTLIEGTTYYHHYDALGSTRQLTNAAGTVTDRITFDAWGNVISRTGSTPISMLWIGEVGYYFDVENELFSVRGRPYEPVTARWTVVDPAGFLDGLNRYLYSSNGPIILVDPSGFLSVKTIAPGLGAQKNPNNKPAIDVGVCGTFQWQANFALGAGEQNGFIVQEVTYTLLTRSCSDTGPGEGGNITMGDCKRPVRWEPTLYVNNTEAQVMSMVKSSVYYELWVVSGGSLYIPKGQQQINRDMPLKNQFDMLSGASDTFGNGDTPEDPVGYGGQGKTLSDLIIVGKLYWFDGNEPPGGWEKWNPTGGQHPAKFLPICCDKPPGTPMKAVTTRYVRMSWNCCCPSASNKCDTVYAFHSNNEPFDVSGHQKGCNGDEVDPIIPVSPE